MSSSPSDSLPALPAEPRALTSPAAADGFEIRQRGWAKRLLPQTTFGRSLLLIVIPLVLVQMIAAWIFYDRHWETVSYRLSADVAGEIAMVIDAVEPAASDPELSAQLRHASDMTELDFTYRSGALLPEAGPASGTTLEKQLGRALTRRVQRPFRIDDAGCERCVLVDVQLDAGVLSVNIPRGRLFTATTYIFILWMVGSSLVLLAIATVFLRNQVKSLRRLAAAAAERQGAARQGAALTLARIDELVLPVRPNALRRCLSNLIANARHYGRHVWVGVLPVEDGIDILIDDDGPGIPAAERERVFHPFVRLDTSRNPSTGGVGLGLTIARDVARSHGGDVRLETSPQGGLRARVHLPRWPIAAAREQRASWVPPPQRLRPLTTCCGS